MIILFGSYAKGNPKEDSDIDIYLETNNNKIKNKVKELNSKLSIKIGKFDAKSLLIKEIIKNHIIIGGWKIFMKRVDFLRKLKKKRIIELVEPSEEMKLSYMTSSTP